MWTENNVKTLTDIEIRARLSEVMDQVVDDCEELIITRQGGKPGVMVSLDIWNSIQETMYLLSTPANAHALRESIAQLDVGQGTERDPITP